MRSSKDLIGKPVYSVDEGRRLGTVRDVYLDKTLSWLAGVHLGKEGLLSRKAVVIPREGITLFGVDAVLAKNADVVSDDKTLLSSENWLRLDELRGREVDTPGGTKLGTIGDVLVDEEARIIGVVLSRVHVEGPLAENPTILRSAVVDTGSQDGVMTVDLSKAEKQSRLDAAEIKEPSLLAEDDVEQEEAD